MKKSKDKKTPFLRFAVTAVVSVLMMTAFFLENVYYAHAVSDNDTGPGGEMAGYVDEILEEEREKLKKISVEQPILALVYLSNEIKVYEEASEDSETIVTVPCGLTVFIEDADIEIQDEYYSEWKLWLRVSFFYNNREYSGYVPDSSVVTSDERFIQWKADSGLDPAVQTATYNLEGDALVNYADVEQFPDSYQASLRALKDSHPQWIFVPMNTNIDWNTAIANEIGGGKSLVHKSLADCMKEGSYDNGSWYFASENALKFYMDPRNGLTENAIFQFEQLTYNDSYHTEAAVNTFLNNTFMKNDHNAPGTDMTFAKIFWEIGKERNVSPFHLASRVYQEQGQGTSDLISGTYDGNGGIYRGYYNYFNVGATGNSDQEYIENGLKYAKSKEWYNAYRSILGGAETISGNYIGRGQDTLYLQKFNVTTNSTFNHQYMQNISAPTSEALSMKKLYQGAGAFDSTFVFKIPVYDNMPDTACAKPESSTNVVLKIPSGYSSAVYLDGIEYAGVSRNGQVIVTAPDANCTNAVVYRYNENGIPVGMYLWTLQYKNNAYVVTPQAELEDLLTYHGFSIRITGKTGIRYKTGISEELRNRLTGGGVNGYVLKEYGTLVMNNANRQAYPMIKGGEKVASGMSYGINADGGLDDYIYERVDGRIRFTSVFVGLPTNQYKTEFAFRGYAVLEKDGVRTTVYGPVMARSMYSLAEQVLGMGTYPEGSDAYNFLHQIINDAQ